MNRRAARAFLVVAFVAAHAHAEDAGGSSDSREKSPVEVHVIGDRSGSLERVPGSGTLITAEDIERAQPVDAGEMLRRVPGLQVRQDESAGLRFDVGVRGLDATRSRRVLMLEDGVPLESNPYAEPEVLFGPTIERARGIEIVKGSGSISYGPETVGGVVEFVTVRPPPGPAATLEADAGDHGFLKALGRYGNAFGGGGYVVQAVHKQGDGFRNDGFGIDDVFGKVVFDTSKRGQATLKLGAHDERAASTEVGLTRSIFETDPRRTAIAPHDHVHDRRLEASVLDDESLGPDTTLRTLAYAYETTQFWRRQDYTRSLAPGTDYERIVGDLNTPNGFVAFTNADNVIDRTYDVLGVEPKLEQRFRSGGFSHVLTVGGRVLVEHALREQRAGATPTSDAGDLQIYETHGTTALAFFAEDKIAFRRGLLVTPGIRVEHASYERGVSRNLVAGKPTDLAISGSSDVDAVVPGLGMVVGTPHAHAFGGLYGGFAPPRAVIAIGTTGQDQHLGAERSTNYELGVRAEPWTWANVAATGFLSVFQNQIIPAGSMAGFLENAGQTRHQGVETSGRVRLGRAFSWPIAIDVGATYTFARATFTNGPYAGRLLPYAPLHSAGVVFDVVHPIGLGGEVAWTHIGEQYADSLDTVAVNASGTNGLLPAYDIVDVNARYRHTPTGLTGLLSVKALTDSIYVSSRRPDGIFTGPFRQITAGVRWDSN